MVSFYDSHETELKLSRLAQLAHMQEDEKILAGIVYGRSLLTSLLQMIESLLRTHTKSCHNLRKI